jgi:dTMP kinase
MFITFEGPDGSGKTTQISLLADYLRREGYAVVTTREPGGTEIGEQVREVLHNLKNTEMLPSTEIFLFQAARAQLVSEIIRPALVDGKVVLSDRYADSTIAYQGYGHRQDLEKLRPIIQFATGGLKPDLTLLLDIDAREGLGRRSSGGEWNRLDDYDLSFHSRVREGYLEMAQAEPDRWVLIDASPSHEKVQASICQVVMARLERIG